jgi:PD-(D/E)XK nuclease superfamily
MERSPLSLQLSQAHLQTLSICPRKFQYSVLEQLGLPKLEIESEQQQLGIQFHQLMQQRELGLNIQVLLEDNPQLGLWFEQFQQSPPPMVSGLHQSEHQRILPWLGVTLIAVYDLLIQGSEEAQIIDWKTTCRPPHARLLESHWQTRLYPFILVETSGYRPEQVSMTYWFAGASETGHTIHFPYSTALHQQTRADLEGLLAPLQSWIQGAPQVQLPQVSESAGHCVSQTQRCAFVRPCGRYPDDGSAHQPALTDLGAIEELSPNSLP